MGGISPGWEGVVEKLAGEYGKTIQEFVPSQIGFLNSVKFNTDYCNGLLEKNKESLITDLENML